MALEQTLAIIKPDAVANGHTGQILSMIEHHGFRIRGMKMIRLSKQQAEAFYEVHKERPFFGGLVLLFMTEGHVAVLALEREDAIKKWREVMGATNPEKAAEGTVRKKFAREHRTQRRTWLGRPRNGCGGDSVLLQPERTALSTPTRRNHNLTGAGG